MSVYICIYVDEAGVMGIFRDCGDHFVCLPLKIRLLYIYSILSLIVL